MGSTRWEENGDDLRPLCLDIEMRLSELWKVRARNEVDLYHVPVGEGKVGGGAGKAWHQIKWRSPISGSI